MPKYGAYYPSIILELMQLKVLDVYSHQTLTLVENYSKPQNAFLNIYFIDTISSLKKKIPELSIG